jgi:2-hydroxychromene-2-carboxylate isomerase
MRGAVGYQMREPDRFLKYVDVMYRGLWTEGLNLGDAAVIGEMLKKGGFDPAAFTAMVGDPEVKAKLIAATDEAVKRGVFGAPTMFVGDAMFFGQDRLEFVREALRN